MATFPVLSSEISDWVSGKEERTLDSLFSKESESGYVPTTTVDENGSLYSNNYECGDGSWHEEYGNWFTRATDGSKSTIFGTNTYHSLRYTTGEWYADCASDPAPDVWNAYDEETNISELKASGFILTALNGSETILTFKVVKSFESSKILSYLLDSYGYIIVGEWGYESPAKIREANAESTSYAYASAETLSPSTTYFSVSGKSRIADYECSGGVSGWTCTPTGTNPPTISVGLNINYAAHYSETYNAVIQLFVYKDDDDAYHGYGQADVGLGDYSVAPTSLAEVGALSSALGSLAVAADSNGISAKYY